MRRTISNRDDMIDSRDIIKRIEELESDLQAAFYEDPFTNRLFNEMADDLDQADRDLANYRPPFLSRPTRARFVDAIAIGLLYGLAGVLWSGIVLLLTIR